MQKVIDYVVEKNFHVRTVECNNIDGEDDTRNIDETNVTVDATGENVNETVEIEMSNDTNSNCVTESYENNHETLPYLPQKNISTDLLTVEFLDTMCEFLEEDILDEEDEFLDGVFE